ncbi:hypothetical protein QQS21_010055 [Conoideocrella luteorostrata]|uniref:Uncharacterized protein n=1 Tax=Conoideocrella luteorostrata TaxID=1105319 RepID=A0AAJ0CFX9_9HYPO|nr:hypothetical protein QQS21_010055 [Conoideocrella luteorostrata]
MRGGCVYAAAGILLAAAASPVSGRAIPPQHDVLDAPTTFVTLDVPKKEGQSIAVTLHLEIGESDSSCGLGLITVNGQELARDGNGNGHGTIADQDKGAIVADWSLSCDTAEDEAQAPVRAAPRMTMSMQIQQLYGEDIAPFNFSATFSPAPPLVRVWNVDGAAVVSLLRRLPKDTPISTLQTQIHGLDKLRIQSRKLHSSISRMEDQISGLLGPELTRKPSSSSSRFQDCDSLACLVDVAGDKLKDAALRFGGDVEGLKRFIANSHDGLLSSEDDDVEYWFGSAYDEDVHGGDGKGEDSSKGKGKGKGEAEPEVFDLKDHGGKWTWVDQYPLSVEEDTDASQGDYSQVTARHQHQPPLAMAIAILVIALCAISSYFLILLHRRTARLPPSYSSLSSLSSSNEKFYFPDPSLHPCPTNSSAAPKESWSDRRARRRARKQAIKEYIRGIFTRWATSTTSAPPTAPPRHRSYSEHSNTMEEEIASFREAVSVVDSLVAAEEGRNREARHPPPPSPPRVPSAHQDRYRRFVTTRVMPSEYRDSDEESLPPYESEDESLTPPR